MGRLKEEAQPVKVDVSMDGATIVLTPLDSAGKELLQGVLDRGMLEWHSQGSEYDPPGNKQNVVGVLYACGGKKYARREGMSTWTDYKGATKVYFDLTNVKDKDARFAMRNFGYFTGGLLVQEGSTSEQLLLSACSVCKVCSGSLREFMELEWKVCNTCAEKCDHSYEEGVGQARGRLAYLPFCTKCGRGDPDWEPSENPVEDLVKTVTEGGFDMLILNHPDSDTATVITRE